MKMAAWLRWRARASHDGKQKPGARARLRAECLKSLIHDSTVFTRHLVIHPEGFRPAA